MARNWVQSGDEPPRQFTTYSPYQLYQRAGITYTAVNFPGCYHGLSVSPAEIPVTLYQQVNDVTVTVDQLPSFISGEQLATELEDRGAESVAGVDGFELYLRDPESEDAWRHALSEDRHLAVKGTDGIDLLRGAIHERDDGNADLTPRMRRLEDVVGIRDSLTVVRNPENAVEFYSSTGQPACAVVTVDMETGKKFAAFAFEDAHTAEALEYVDSRPTARSEYYDIVRQEGRLWTAEGDVSFPPKHPRNVHIQELEEFKQKYSYNPIISPQV